MIIRRLFPGARVFTILFSMMIIIFTMIFITHAIIRFMIPGCTLTAAGTDRFIFTTLTGIPTGGLLRTDRYINSGPLHAMDSWRVPGDAAHAFPHVPVAAQETLPH